MQSSRGLIWTQPSRRSSSKLRFTMQGRIREPPLLFEAEAGAPALNLYTEEDVRRALDFIRPLPFGRAAIDPPGSRVATGRRGQRRIGMTPVVFAFPGDLAAGAQRKAGQS